MPPSQSHSNSGSPLIWKKVQQFQGKSVKMHGHQCNKRISPSFRKWFTRYTFSVWKSYNRNDREEKLIKELLDLFVPSYQKVGAKENSISCRSHFPKYGNASYGIASIYHQTEAVDLQPTHLSSRSYLYHSNTHRFYYPRPVLAFGYCRRLCLCVHPSVCVSITCFSVRELETRSSQDHQIWTKGVKYLG